MPMGRFSFLIQKLRTSCILTMRGTILALTGLYLLIIPVIQQQDLVASVISISLLLILLLFTLGTLFLRYKLKKLSDWQILPPGKHIDAHSIHSGETVTLLCKLPIFRLLPYYELELEIVFREEDIRPKPLRIVGNVTSLTHVPTQVVFPHRGRWHPHHLQLCIGDQLGLTRLTWTSAFSSSAEIEVCPPFIPEYSGKFPILSSSYRSGDTLPDLHTRMGDYYDIRQYQDGDNLNKILWKAYARTGDLYSRHPERSMTPEGTVVFYVPAHRYDDDLAVSAIDYARLLEDNGIEIIGSCYGAEGKQAASSAEELQELLIDSVWHIPEEVRAEDQLWQFISTIKSNRPSMNIRRVLLFCKEEHLVNEPSLQEYLELGELLSKNMISPIYCIHEVLHNVSASAQQQRTQKKHNDTMNQLRDQIRKQLIVSDSTQTQPKRPERYPEFLRICMSNQWEVIS